MKHDVRSCGCDFTKCPLHIRREKTVVPVSVSSWFWILQVLTSRRHLNVENFQLSTRTISFTTRKFLVYLVKWEDHQKTKKKNFSPKLFSLWTDCAVFISKFGTFVPGSYLSVSVRVPGSWEHSRLLKINFSRRGFN